MFYILRHLQGRKLLERTLVIFGKSVKRNLTKNKTAPAATGTVQVTFRRMIPQFTKYCIIFGQPTQENESSLAVIFVPNFKKGR